MKKKLISIFLSLAVILSISLTAYAETSANESKKSIAVVAQTVQIDGVTEVFGRGTGFFVGKSGEAPKYMITNYHVISEYMENGQGELMSAHLDDGTDHIMKMLLRVYFDAADYIEAYVVDYDEKQDFAILRLEGTTNKRVPLKIAAPTDNMVGESMYSAGFPAITDNVVLDPTSQWGMDDAIIIRGTLGRLITTSGSGAQWIETTDMNWSGGNSGGPVLIDGVVIGMVKGTVESSDNENVNYAVSMEPVIKLLQKNNIEFELANSGFNIMAFLPFIIACVAAIAVIVAVILIARKSKKTKAEKKMKEEMEHLKSELQNQPKKQPIVRSMAPQHNGARVLVKSVPMMIGRDPSCSIIYRKDTPGVSGVHCSVAFDPATEDFIVIDLKSTYGTFLINGHKLNPNVGYRMRSGDSFYLGDPGNVLRVELEQK